MIRPAEKKDITELIVIAHKCYGDFDDKVATEWCRKAMDNPTGVFVRSDNGFGVGAISQFFWEPDVSVARLVFLAVDQVNPMALEGYELLCAMAIWARQMGAKSFSLGSETGVDFGPFAKRLKACKDLPSYTLTF